MQTYLYYLDNVAMLAVQSTKKFRECEAVESTRKWKCWMHCWPISETPTRNAFMTCPLQSNVSSKIMRLGNCASALTRYEYVDQTSKLRAWYALRNVNRTHCAKRLDEARNCYRALSLRALPESDEARKHHGGLLVHQDPDPDFYVDKNKYLTKA